MQYHLPPYEKCPIHFLREVLAGDKLVSLAILHWKVLRKESVIHLDVPKYKKLSVHSIWPLVREVSSLTQYFPTLQPNQTPDRNYMFSILANSLQRRDQKYDTEFKEKQISKYPWRSKWYDIHCQEIIWWDKGSCQSKT